MNIETKQSNPKDTVGCNKVSMSFVPATVMAETALGMMEGGLKYGRHNYRAVGVRASIYYDATLRHLMAWWEGEDNDPDPNSANISHITKAICSLVVMRDAMLCDKFFDDRPPKSPKDWLILCNEAAKRIVASKDDPVPAFTQTDCSWSAK